MRSQLTFITFMSLVAGCSNDVRDPSHDPSGSGGESSSSPDAGMGGSSSTGGVSTSTGGRTAATGGASTATGGSPQTTGGTTSTATGGTTGSTGGATSPPQDGGGDGCDPSKCDLPAAVPEGCVEATCVDGECRFVGVDMDHDGFRTSRCTSKTAGVYVAPGNDCDDTDATVNPNGWDGPAGDGFENGCDDGIDQNCNGAVDDGQLASGATCACTPGEAGACAETTSGVAIQYPQLVDGKPLGQCKLGSRQCLPNGTWSSCSGAVPPEAETCDGKDNDCDGAADDNPIDRSNWSYDWDGDGHSPTQWTAILACPAANNKPSVTPPECPSNETRCKDLTKWRLGNLPTDDCNDFDATFSPASSDSPKCDGKDYDCNGTPNTGCTCTTGAKQNCSDPALCGTGQATCQGGTWGACVGLTNPVTYCRDEDGDGYCKLSDCVNRCSLPDKYRVKTACTSQITPDCNDTIAESYPGKTEVCNSIDDDCAGGVDNVAGNGSNCHYQGLPTGACSNGGTLQCPASSPPAGAAQICGAKAANEGPSATYLTTAAPNGSWDWNCDGAVSLATPDPVNTWKEFRKDFGDNIACTPYVGNAATATFCNQNTSSGACAAWTRWYSPAVNNCSSPDGLVANCGSTITYWGCKWDGASCLPRDGNGTVYTVYCR